LTANAAVPQSDELPSSADVVVIGGGVIGAACAHALAEAQVSTLLVEAREVGSGASGACEGNVLISDKSPGPELELARRSLELYEELEQRLDADIQRETKGSLLVAPSEEAAELLDEEAAWMEAEGLSVRRLDPAAVLQAEPVLDQGIEAGLFVADDLQVCPMRLVLAFARSSRRLGVRLVRGCPVDRIEVESGRVSAVTTSRGRVSCAAVVVAAGVGTRDLLKKVGEDLPLTGRRGQILVSAPAPGLIRHKVYDFGYRATVREQGEDGVQVATVLENTRRGNVLIGASREFRETTADPDPAVDAVLARRALELAPGLAHLKILRSYAGIRPTLPDGIPAIGPVESVHGLLVASGHEGAGIGLAPATAEVITAEIVGGEAPVSPQPFLPGRFTSHGGSRIEKGAA
jgi:glycine/D-amino acid oxidase-like deaminating enzyme